MGMGSNALGTEAISHAFGERPVLKLMYATLIRASHSWRRIVISDFELRQIEELCAELEQQYQEHTASAVKPASRPIIFSNRRT